MILQKRCRVLKLLKYYIKGYNRSVDPIQKQLERLELGSILVSQTVGRTRLFMFNPRYAFKKELEALLLKAREFYAPEEIEWLTKQRKRLR